MMPKENVSTAIVSLLPTWNSSGARCVTVPEPDLWGGKIRTYAALSRTIRFDRPVHDVIVLAEYLGKAKVRKLGGKADCL